MMYTMLGWGRPCAERAAVADAIIASQSRRVKVIMNHMLSHHLSRRELVLGAATAAAGLAAPPAAPEIDRAVVARNDAAVERVLINQVTSQASPYRGSVPDDYLFHTAQSAAGVIEACAAALVCPQS